MLERVVKHGTFTIERKFTAPPKRVFRAFSSLPQKRRWFAGGRAAKGVEFKMDFRVGGWERTRSRMGDDTPFAGAVLANDTCYLDIVPAERIVVAYTMSLDGRRFSVSLGTYDFKPDGSGTLLVYTDQGAYFERSDGPRMRKAGWDVLFGALGVGVND